MLWGRSVVLNDVETLSEWSHILGRAMAGRLKGRELTVLPSVVVTWKRWREEHPETTVSVFSRVTQKYTPDYYREPEKFALGLRHRGQLVAYPLTALMKHVAINDDVGGDAIVAVYDRQGAGATAYRRTIRGTRLDFSAADGRLVAGGSTWSATTGEALDGPWKGQSLQRLSAMISFETAWRAYHTGSRWWGE
jgi:hypothetical protein